MKNQYEIQGNVTYLFVTCRGEKRVCRISTKDLALVQSVPGTWYGNYNKFSNTFYVKTHVIVDGKRKSIQIHRLLTNCPEHLVVNHKNHDTLDNTRENIEVVSQGENISHSARINPTGYRGINWHKGINRYLVRVKVNGKEHYIGSYKTLDEAIAENNKARIELGAYIALPEGT